MLDTINAVTIVWHFMRVNNTLAVLNNLEPGFLSLIPQVHLILLCHRVVVPWFVLCCVSWTRGREGRRGSRDRTAWRRSYLRRQEVGTMCLCVMCLCPVWVCVCVLSGSGSCLGLCPVWVWVLSGSGSMSVLTVGPDFSVLSDIPLPDEEKAELEDGCAVSVHPTADDNTVKVL